MPVLTTAITPTSLKKTSQTHKKEHSIRKANKKMKHPRLILRNAKRLSWAMFYISLVLGPKQTEQKMEANACACWSSVTGLHP